WASFHDLMEFTQVIPAPIKLSVIRFHGTKEGVFEGNDDSFHHLSQLCIAANLTQVAAIRLPASQLNPVMLLELQQEIRKQVHDRFFKASCVSSSLSHAQQVPLRP